LFSPYAQKQWKMFKLSSRPHALSLVLYGNVKCSSGSKPKVLGMCCNFLCTRTHMQACLRARQVLAVDLDRTVTDTWAWNKTRNLRNPSSLSPLPFVIRTTTAGGLGRMERTRLQRAHDCRRSGWRGPLRRSMYVQNLWAPRSLFQHLPLWSTNFHLYYLVLLHFLLFSYF
jgi:hypothetical protein